MSGGGGEPAFFTHAEGGCQLDVLFLRLRTRIKDRISRLALCSTIFASVELN